MAVKVTPTGYTETQGRLNAEMAKLADGHAVLVRCFAGPDQNHLELGVKDGGYTCAFHLHDPAAVQNGVLVETMDGARDYATGHPFEVNEKGIPADPCAALDLYWLGMHDGNEAGVIPDKEPGGGGAAPGYRILLAEGTVEFGVRHEDLVEMFMDLSGKGGQHDVAGHALFRKQQDPKEVPGGAWSGWLMDMSAAGRVPWILSEEAKGYTPKPGEAGLPIKMRESFIGREWWHDGLEPEERAARLAAAQRDAVKLLRESRVLRVEGMTVWAPGVANGWYFSPEETRGMVPRLEASKESREPEDVNRYSIFQDHQDGVATYVGYIDPMRGYWWDEAAQEVRGDAVFIDEALQEKMRVAKAAGIPFPFGISPVLNFARDGRKAVNIDLVNLSIVDLPAGGKRLMIDPSRIRESVGPNRWKIVLVEEGVSANRQLFTRAVLEKEAPKFDGVVINAWELAPRHYDHIPIPLLERVGPYRFACNTIGVVREPRVELVDGKWAIVGTAEICDQDFNLKIETMRDAMGFSIDTEDAVKEREVKCGRIVDVVRDFGKVLELTLVSSASAGGRVLNRLAASENRKEREGAESMEKHIVELLCKAFSFVKAGMSLAEAERLIAENKKLSMATVEDVVEAVVNRFKVEGDIPFKADEAMAYMTEKFRVYEVPAAVIQPAPSPEPPPAAVPQPGNEYDTKFQQVTEALDRVVQDQQARAAKEFAATIDTKLRESNLTADAVARVRDLHGKMAEKTVENLDHLIAMERQRAASTNPSGLIRLREGYSRVEVFEHNDRLQAGLDEFFGVKVADNDADGRRLRESAPSFGGSIRQAYVAFTGGLDPEVRGYCDDPRRLREATTSDFTYALSVSMTKRVAQLYREMQAAWRKIVTVGRISSFKQQEIIRWGSFGVLETVSESDSSDYPVMGFPGDERAVYTPFKKGGLIVFTREMIKNDDMRLFQRTPAKITSAAHETLNRFAFDILVGWGSSAINGATYGPDSLAYYHVFHGNLGTQTIGYAGFDALWRKLEEQWEYGAKDAINYESGYNSAATSLVVDDGTKFQIGDYAEIRETNSDGSGTDNLEIVYVSNVSTNTLTVTRAQFGTTAGAIVNDDEIRVLGRVLGLELPPICVYPNAIDSDIIQLHDTPKKPGLSTEGTNKFYNKFVPLKSHHLRGSAVNYYLVCDPKEREGIIVEFMDGQEEPVVLVQDAPVVGNVFMRDNITYKVRHEYGGTLADKAAVAAYIA